MSRAASVLVILVLMSSVGCSREPSIQKEAQQRYENLRSQAAGQVANDPQFDQARQEVAALINSNGQLCAEVVDVRPLRMRENVFEVTCVEYRGGSSRVRYLVDGPNGTASRL